MVESVEAYIFYFDLIGFTDQYCRSSSNALTRLREFQRESRQEFCFSSPHSYIVTLYDNVWCRVNASQTGMPSLLLDFAGKVMTAAHAKGFLNYFGTITKGIHEFEPDDRMLVGKHDFEDLTEQHIDITSEPHIRAAMSEKWAKNTTRGSNCVWVSSEVASSYDVQVFSELEDSAYVVYGDEIDLGETRRGTQAWPFASSVFQAIRPKRSGDAA